MGGILRTVSLRPGGHVGGLLHSSARIIFTTWRTACPLPWEGSGMTLLANYSKVLSSTGEDLSSDTVAVRRYIENHYREPLTLDLLAQSVHMNKFHLAHTFSKEFGLSPFNYIQQLRIRESKELLCTTDYPLTQIASMCGFSSPSYFSQRFRASAGISPAEYRKRNKGKDDVEK